MANARQLNPCLKHVRVFPWTVSVIVALHPSLLHSDNGCVTYYQISDFSIIYPYSEANGMTKFLSAESGLNYYCLT